MEIKVVKDYTSPKVDEKGASIWIQILESALKFEISE
jgi:hypothetical protein